MIYEIEPNITINPDKQPRAYEQEVKRIAGLVEDHLNFQEMPHVIEEDGCMIWVTTLLPLLEKQEAWLRTVPEIHGIGLYTMGGTLTFTQRRPTTQTYPCIFSSPTDSTTRLEIMIGLDGLTSYLHLHGGKGIKLTNDQEMLEQLQHASLPLDGWQQTVWLCRRCGQPGARDTMSMCASCEAAYQMFMEIPFQEGLEHSSHSISANVGRFCVAYDNQDQELRLSWPGGQVLCDPTESQHLLHFLLATLPFNGKQNDALLQYLDLQAAHRLIETLPSSYRIEQEAKQVVLVQQNAEGYALAAWALPADNRERAVRAVLAAEGDYHPTDAERLELQTLFKTLEGPEDEDEARPAQKED